MSMEECCRDRSRHDEPVSLVTDEASIPGMSVQFVTHRSDTSGTRPLCLSCHVLQSPTRRGPVLEVKGFLSELSDTCSSAALMSGSVTGPPVNGFLLFTAAGCSVR